MTVSTDAIVLRREPSGDTNVRLMMYTRAFGKVEALARGLRRIESKLAPHTDSLSATEVLLASGRGGWLLAGSVLTNRYASIRASLPRLRAAGQVVRAVDLMTPIESNDLGVFALLDNALTLLNDERVTTQSLSAVADFFVWQLFARMGYQPMLERCAGCTLALRGDSYIRPRAADAWHASCFASGESAVRISHGAVNGLRYMANAPLTHVPRLNAAPETFEQISRVLRSLVEEHYELNSATVFA